jgi:putative flippase GtrA
VPHLPPRVEASRFLRFAAVGGAGFLIDTGLLAVLHHGAGIDPFASRIASILAAAVSTWRLNRSFTFGASPSGQAAEGLRYALVMAGAAVVNYALYAAALIAWPSLSPVAATVAATLCSMLVSYLGYSRFVFQGARLAVLAEPRSQSR